MPRGADYVLFHLRTRLSPEDGDDGLSVMASLLCCCISIRRVVVHAVRGGELDGCIGGVSVAGRC